MLYSHFVASCIFTETNNIWGTFFKGAPVEPWHLYGLDPKLRAALADKPVEKMPVLTPLQDRVANLEALTLALLAEMNLPMTAAPQLVEFAMVSSVLVLLFSLKRQSV